MFQKNKIVVVHSPTSIFHLYPFFLESLAKNFVKYAAACLVLLFSSYFWLRKQANKIQLERSQNIRLPDGLLTVFLKFLTCPLN